MQHLILLNNVTYKQDVLVQNGLGSKASLTDVGPTHFSMDFEDAHNGRGLSGAFSANPAKDIIGAEDEEFENDLDQTVDDQCSHFNSIELLKCKPTHLLVFLHHVILQFDCAPLLCFLHADLFRNLSTKETKKHFVDFYNSFLDKGAILRVAVPPHIAYELDRTRPDLISEDQQKRFAHEIQFMQSKEVLRQLEDFRQKRMMGMTPNEHELTEVENHYPTDRVPREMKEKAVAERLLEKLIETNPAIVSDEDKCSAIFSAVAFYMKQLGVKSRPPDSKKGKGFFRRKVQKKEDKSKVLGILRLGGSSSDKEKNNERRNNVGSIVHRGSNTDGSALPSMARKSASGACTSHGTETSDLPHSNIIIISSPETSQPETGQPSIRLDQSVSDGGDISPACPNVDIVWEPPAVTDVPVEESHDKDRSVRRSESLCVERCHSRRGGSTRAKQSRSRSDVDLQSTSTSQPPSPFPQPTRFGDSPVLPVDCSGKGNAFGPLTQQEEIEPRLLELEQDPPNWRELASSEALRKLTKKEIKRQEVINELFATEHAHVRMLSVLQTVFSRPLEREGIMESTELDTIFPSLDEIIEMHYAFYENLKKLRQEDVFVVKHISILLLNRFNGSEGEWFQKLTARFCSRQSWTLVQLKNRQKKDPRFNAFILEAESKPQCRRLQLKDIIPIEMQRLTKYPLLLENIAKNTDQLIEISCNIKQREALINLLSLNFTLIYHDSYFMTDTQLLFRQTMMWEKENTQQAAECCRKILNQVNEAVKEMENLLTLKDYQRRLDTSGLKPSNELYTEYRSIDLTTRSMIYEGPLTWRVTKEKALDVQGVLLGDLLVLLQKQDDKMLLKCQNRKAFYVIFTWESGAQIYELVAQSIAERKIWTDLIQSSVDELKKGGGLSLDRMRLGSVPSNSSALAYTASLNPPLSPTDNGTDVHKNSAGQYKDSLSDEKFSDIQPSLIDCLAANGFNPLAYSSTPPVRSGVVAMDEVMSLKTLLVRSSCQPKNAEPEGESGAEPGKQEIVGAVLTLKHCMFFSQLEEHNMESQEDVQDEKTKEDELKAVAAPLVLSQEQIEEVRRKLESLEEHTKRLQLYIFDLRFSRVKVLTETLRMWFLYVETAANAANPPKINLEFDNPGLRLAVSKDATIRCCYSCQGAVEVVWIQDVLISNKTCVPKHVDDKTDPRVEINNTVNSNSNVKCSFLTLRNINLSDMGLYKCGLKQSNTSVLTPGTYLQVYVPLQKMLDISEESKNSIIIAEGILLLLFMLLPGFILIYKSKGLNELKNEKSKEEENIYEGLNLDDCNSTYHQIQHSLIRGPYQDIMLHEEDDIQLEKP
ncbi:Rho guanine nucleotide exchange factor 1 [Bagarius yarrelli]|uniref:Rho guanine nucleotide exchange factor 1 n=1 Tax=Bagarius yarrelli TaxID=175774 RepID=A0A556TM45_BAGYA|nr:Rho guanine nucleotide exchange factor 1 [Bagarius yarrelli]